MSSRRQWTLGDKIAFGILIGTMLTVGIGLLTFFDGRIASSSPKEPASTTQHPSQNGPTTSQPQSTSRPSLASYLDMLQITQQEGGEAEVGVVHVGPTRYRHGVTLPYTATAMFGPELVTFALPGQYTTFRALVGFDPNAKENPNQWASRPWRVAMWSLTQSSAPLLLRVRLKRLSQAQAQSRLKHVQITTVPA